MHRVSPAVLALWLCAGSAAAQVSDDRDLGAGRRPDSAAALRQNTLLPALAPESGVVASAEFRESLGRLSAPAFDGRPGSR